MGSSVNATGNARYDNLPILTKFSGHFLGVALRIDRGITRPDNRNHWLVQKMQIAFCCDAGARIIILSQTIWILFTVAPQ